MGEVKIAVIFLVKNSLIDLCKIHLYLPIEKFKNAN